MKTVKFKGQVYQLNTLYEFSDLGTSWHLETLENICDKGFFETFDEREEVGSSWKMCRSVSGELGTITDAPIELEDGEWYMCASCNSRPAAPFKYLGTSDNESPLWGVDDGDLNKEPYQIKPMYKMVRERT